MFESKGKSKEESKELSTVQSRMKEMALQESSTDTYVGSYISTQGGTLSVGGMEIEGNQLDTVIVSYNVEHTYYTKKFDSENPADPDCFAIYTPGDKDVAPHANSIDKQSETCHSCSKRKFGSSPLGKGRACSERRKLAVITFNNVENNTIEEADICIIKVPPTSVRVFQKYVSTVTQANRKPICMLGTRISLVPHKKFVFSMEFKNISSDIPEEYFERLLALKDQADIILSAPYGEENG